MSTHTKLRTLTLREIYKRKIHKEEEQRVVLVCPKQKIG
jgi:hypothetical protein